MKNLILATALLFSASVLADANREYWTLNENNAAVIFSENTLSKEPALLGYAPCKQTLMLWDEQYGNLKETQTVAARFKVDDNQMFVGDLEFLNEFYFQGERHVVVGIQSDIEIIEQMIKGNYLRIQYKNRNGDWSDTLIERYSLKGFTKAASKALDACSSSSDTQYFNQTKDSDFF